MLTYDLALGEMLPASQQQSSARDSIMDSIARIIEARMRSADGALPDDPDAAALLIGGVLAAIPALWLARGTRQPPLLLSVPLECGDSHVGLRLRLALRAPNVEARLAHRRALLRMIAEDEGDEDNVR